MEHSHLQELKRHGFTHYDDIETALKKFFATAKIPRLRSESIPLAEAALRVLSQDIIAKENLPGHNKSLVDGYALRADDTSTAKKTKPRLLKIQSEINLGETPRARLSHNQCVWVPTGGYLPENADSVVMFEETHASRGSIRISRPVRSGENVIIAGADVRKGELLFERGHILRWFELGLLAAMNISTIQAFRRPRVAVLSTGDELSEPGGRGTPDSNRHMLLSALNLAGADVIDLGISKDNLRTILSSLRQGLKAADMILVSGGSSVGKKDLVPEAVSALGKPGIIVHGVAMRPGSPTGLASVNGKVILILPGFHLSALVAFFVFGQRILQRMLGTHEPLLSTAAVSGKMIERLPGGKGMIAFRPVQIRGRPAGVEFAAIKPYGSSIVSSIARADGIATIPSQTQGLKKGEIVSVDVLRPLRGIHLD